MKQILNDDVKRIIHPLVPGYNLSMTAYHKKTTDL